jgi:hypothetical protein
VGESKCGLRERARQGGRGPKECALDGSGRVAGQAQGAEAQAILCEVKSILSTRRELAVRVGRHEVRKGLRLELGRAPMRAGHRRW